MWAALNGCAHHQVTSAGTGAPHHLKYASSVGGTPGTALWVPTEHSVVFTVSTIYFRRTIYFRY